MINDVVGLLVMAAWFLVMIRIFGKVFAGRFGKPRTVKAQVVGKQTVEFFSKYAPGNKRVRYVVNFLVDGKKKSFLSRNSPTTATIKANADSSPTRASG